MKFFKWLRDLKALVKEYRDREEGFTHPLGIRAIVKDRDGRFLELAIPRVLDSLRLPEVVGRIINENEPPEQARIRIYKCVYCKAGMALYEEAVAVK